ncbi:MAG: Uma2 family endonuclease [Verrucomicrobia bacterium]|nr:Uma2 family endonuclease [Verrucomicrobiota bacterium]
MAALMEELLASTELPVIVEQLRARMEDEQARREKFYEEVSEEHAEEFINGAVFKHSPVPWMHARVFSRLVRLLGNDVQHRGLGEIIFGKTLVVTTRNDYMPDLSFYGTEKASAFYPEQSLLPPPDFVAEILSPSTEQQDRGVKFKDYALHGVGEYWLIDPARETVEKYVLRERAYAAAGTFGGGQIESEVVAGFAIPVRALFDDAENRRAVDAIIRNAPAGS